MKNFDPDKEWMRYLVLFGIVLLLPFLVGWIMLILAMIL